MMTRQFPLGCFLVGLVSSLCSGTLADDEPAPEPGQSASSAPAKTLQEARGLVAELEIQAESLRGQLQKTETTLARAKRLVETLEQECPDELTQLKKRERVLREQLSLIKRRVRFFDTDPAARHAEGKLKIVLDRMKDLEGR